MPDTHSRALLTGALVVACAIAARAQERTTATYDDWVLQCQMEAGPPAQKTCDIAQVTQLQGRNVPVSRIAISHPQKGQPVKLSAQVPVNVSVRASVRLQTSDTDAGLTAPFEFCVPAGCFATFELNADALRKFRTASGPGKLTFKNATGRDVVIPISFKGFGPAFDALMKE